MALLSDRSILERYAKLFVALAAQNVEAIGVCLINSYLNPVHEQEVANLIFDELGRESSSAYRLIFIRRFASTSAPALPSSMRR